MSTIATDMPPLHSVEAVIGVSATVSSQSTSIGGTAGAGAPNNSIIDSTQSPDTKNLNNSISSTNSQSNSNNTISAAADSSDNQPSTPQPHHANINDTQQNSSAAPHPYVNHHIYSTSQTSTTTAANTHLNQMYPQHIYSQSNMDLQQQQQQLQQPSSYPSYLNSYEQFYQQQQQQQQNPSQPSSQTQNPQQMDYINSNTNSLFAPTDYKHQAPGVRYQPYLHTPPSGISTGNPQNSNANNPLDSNSQTAPIVSAASSSLMSPRVVSSTSPSSSSNQMQVSGSASSIGSLSAGNPSSPNSATTPQCKKCGIMCTNESELQEHITNVHGASPYGSSGYASSPYIKEEMQQTPPSQQSATQQAASHGGNPGEILDLDSQKMLYPPTGASMTTMIHQPLGNADPLHGLHSMQQRAGISTWDQQSQEGVPSFMQQPTESKNLPNHSPFYQSPKQSPYHVTNSSNVIKTEYQPIVKTEFTADAQQYISDKSFDPTAPNQQPQQMMPPAISSSPAEFPSTTTGGPQDNGQQNAAVNQQFRGGNFEPPSSSSAALPSGPVSGKAANWKSNEARRPKTYNCTACNKWFTSSGHLKRHYNTTLHKNAVKSSGQPDPATLPISVHHHPSRDPTGKTGRRGAAAAANAASVANQQQQQQQQQQQPNPVQPPEPPNSPQDYGSSQVAAGGLTPLSHYAATPSPNSMYQQHQQYQQHQYMPQAQSTSNSSPQHASSMVVNHHLQQQQQQQNQQQAVMNGHPNALAGPSVSPTQQQAPMPSSQMRGLLNSPMPTTRVHILKSDQLEAAIMQEQMHPSEEVDELAYLKAVAVKQEFSEETPDHIIYSPKANEASLREVGGLSEDQVSQIVIHHLQEAAEGPREADHNVGHHHNNSQAQTPSQIQHYQLEQQHQLDMNHHYPNTTCSSPHNNMQLHSPLIISHQQYQEQLQQQQQQTVGQAIYTLMQTPPPSPPQQQPHNIMGQQPFINMPLAINTQQPPSNMLQQQQPLITTERQPLPPATTIRTTNIVNMLPPSPHPMQLPQQQHMELQPLPNTQLQLDTINTSIPSPIITNSITNMPSYPQLQHPGLVLPPLDHTPNYPHTIIGNAEVVTVDAYGNLVSASEQQLIQSADGQYLQFVPTEPSDYYMDNKIPLQGDLPPITLQCHQEPIGAKIPPPDTSEYRTVLRAQRINSRAPRKSPSKRSKHPNSYIGPLNEVLPDGRIKCIPCRKIFSRICYLTQHNSSFHNGKYQFRCDKCGKRFKSFIPFIVHYAKHKCTDKAHKCHLCPKQFHHKTDLRRHIDGIHTGNKQHSCHICQKSFCRRDHLLKHIETHNRPRSTGKRNKSNAAKANKKPKEFALEQNNLIQLPLNNSEGILFINPSTTSVPAVTAALSPLTPPNSPICTTNGLCSPIMMQQQNNQDLLQQTFQNIQYSNTPTSLYEQYMQPSQYEIYEIVQQPMPTYSAD